MGTDDISKIIASATQLHEKPNKIRTQHRNNHLSSQFVIKNDKVRLPSLSSTGVMTVPQSTKQNKYKYVTDIAHLMPKSLNLDL